MILKQSSYLYFWILNQIYMQVILHLDSAFTFIFVLTVKHHRVFNRRKEN